MKTVELSIPTSFREIGVVKRLQIIKEYLGNITNKISNYLSTSKLFIKSNTLKVVEFLFSTLRSISFSKSNVDSNFTSREKGSRIGRKNLPFGKIGKYAFGGIVAVLIVFVISRLVSSDGASNDTRLEVKDAKATTMLEKVYQFPFFDEDGEEISNFEYMIEKAELRDEVLIQGRPARAIEGKTFLVLYIKIKNDYKGSLQLNSSEYVRLVVDGNENELLAPDMNSDPVEIQAISTKTTRLGFPIDDESVDSLKLQVGVIDGVKETIDIKF